METPFTDNMVLQRNMKVPVWGTAAAEEASNLEQVRFVVIKENAVGVDSARENWKVCTPAIEMMT